jgi:hypothetical protein
VTYFEHALAALALQAALGLLTGRWWTSAALVSGYFIGREVAQAEYRWIELYGNGLRANMPWWGPLDLRVWPKVDQWMDLFAPVIATCSLAAFRDRR